jgi:ribokinase
MKRMPRILNFGSLNIDHVYGVDHFARPGETLCSADYRVFAGGKGNNQSVALARAGAHVWHAGKVGREGAWLRDRLRAAGVHTAGIEVGDTPTGHAIIQVNRQGQNSIVLFGGANRTITAADAARRLEGFSAGDWLLLQNEISGMPAILRMGARCGMKIFFNPAPMDPKVFRYPLRLVTCFCLNETEAEALTGERRPPRVLTVMRRRFPRAAVVLTLGAKGALYGDAQRTVHAPSVRVRAVDTTAAGDTFIGYFLAFLAQGKPVEICLRIANRAAAVCVTRPGAAESIPTRAEL